MARTMRRTASLLRRLRICSSALAAAALLAAMPAGAAAQDYPSRVIKLICPFPPGVSTDVLARALAQHLTTALGQTVIVENRPGANGIIAATALARSEPDGYTFLITTGSHTTNPHVAATLPYHALNDFAPITQLVASYGLALISNLPVKSLKEIVALAKEKPGKLSYAHSGTGNLTHVAARLFEKRAGIEMVSVPYNNPNLIADVLSGTVDMTFISMVNAVPLVTGGKIKAFAITGPKRSPKLPDVPTMQELGYKDYSLLGWFGIMFPAKTPPQIVQRIHDETVKALAKPELKKLIDDSSLYAVGSTPEEFGKFLKQDYDYQAALMKDLGLNPK